MLTPTKLPPWQLTDTQDTNASETKDVVQLVKDVAAKIEVERETTTAENPHQSPPRFLKDVFKKYCTTKKLDDPCIVDFEVNSTEGLLTVPGNFLGPVFACFDGQAAAEVPGILNTAPASYYEFEDIPGLVLYPGLLPPEAQRKLLSRLLHRDLSNPRHQTNLHLHYNISYPAKDRSFFSDSPSTVLFQPKDPKVHKPLPLERVLHRKLRWMTLGGQYDWTKKIYPAGEPPEFPVDIANLIRGIFPSIDPQAAIVNLYSPGDTLSLHRDVSEQVDKDLISISLGCDCLFVVGVEDKEQHNGFRHRIIRLRSGDVIVMKDKARFAWHGVPKIIPDTCPKYLADWPTDSTGEFPEWADWMKNKRINLNVRQMRESPKRSLDGRRWVVGQPLVFHYSAVSTTFPLSDKALTIPNNPTLGASQYIYEWLSLKLAVRKQRDTYSNIFIMVDWQALAKEKRESVIALIPKTWLLSCPLPSATEQRDVTGKYIQQFLSPQEIEITETDAVGIVNNTTSGTWKARDVAEAFCHRAALAHQMVNCLHEIFFDAAIADAQKLDDYYDEHKKPIGPLHGLPVSLKDQFHVKGVETTMGYVGWIGTFEGKKGTGKEKVFESEMVRELRSLGAVLYCKTSVPHTLMTGETVNNIIGYTFNPKNRNLSCGGSSGGEGALIGLKGSPVGFGTDIGGSIRIPSAFNGLYGIRPSAGRLPYEGMANSMDGQNSILSVVGPIATSVGALKLVIKGVLSQQPWLHDPLVAEIPWRHEQEQVVLDIVKASGGGQLAFGIIRSDGIVQPQPPVRRAIDIVVKTIEKLGHKVFEWKPPSHARGLEIAFKTWIYDGGADVHGAFALSGEPMASQLTSTYGTLVPEYTASQIATVNVQKRQYQKEYMEYWNSTSSLTGTGRPVDAIVAPLAPYAAARPDMKNFGNPAKRVMPGLSTWVNLLDYSAAVLPVTTADKSVDVVDVGYKPLNETDEKVWKGYDPEIYDGAHVSVQIVGRRFQEEKVLALTEILGDALGKHVV